MRILKLKGEGSYFQDGVYLKYLLQNGAIFRNGRLFVETVKYNMPQQKSSRSRLPDRCKSKCVVNMNSAISRNFKDGWSPLRSSILTSSFVLFSVPLLPEVAFHNELICF